MTTLAERQTALLRRWASASREWLFTPAGREDLLYYGDGTNGWGTQTNQKACAAFAALASVPGEDPLYREQALAMLRYSLETHIEGSFHLTDGENTHWGHTWISILGLERMMYGIEALWDAMTDADRDLLRRVILSEADWQLTQETLAGVDAHGGRNKPESNMWNGCLLLRAAAMYPDAPNRASYLEKGRELTVNAVSVPSDCVSEKIYAGKYVADWYRGANFEENLSLDHHGYMNVGYMVITLSQAAMYHFSMKRMGCQPEETVYHHAHDLWKLIRSLMFDDGRLWRIGGDTRVRYCYCQDFLIHVLCMAQELFGEDTEDMEHCWAALLEKEMDYNGDGSFLGKRCELFRERSPLYYTRLESDRANALGFSLFYRPDIARSLPSKAEIRQWHDGFHGSCMVRGEKRLASFNWRGANGPQGTCVPPQDSSMAEWMWNLASEVNGDGGVTGAVTRAHNERMLKDGFVTCGTYTWHTSGLLAEQIAEEDTVLSRLCFAALPDGVTVVTVQSGTAVKDCHLQNVKPLCLKIPNDVYNGFRRDYAISEDGRRCVVDGILTVTAAEECGRIEILKPPYRQIGLDPVGHGGKFLPYRERGFLHCDEICVSPVKLPAFVRKGQCLYSFAAAVTTDGKGTEIAMTVQGGLRVCTVRGADGNTYVLKANLGDSDVCLPDTAERLAGMTAMVEAI